MDALRRESRYNNTMKQQIAKYTATLNTIREETTKLFNDKAKLAQMSPEDTQNGNGQRTARRVAQRPDVSQKDWPVSDWTRNGSVASTEPPQAAQQGIHEKEGRIQKA